MINLKLHSIAMGIVVIVIVIIGFQIASVKASNEIDRIEAANLSINHAFANVLVAESAGGNISDLLTKLNGAGELLTEAKNDYQSGNLVDVNAKADNATIIANQVNTDAVNLTINSKNYSENKLVLTIIFSIVAIILFLAALRLFWRRAKRGYYKKLFGSKPEVVNNQT
jgi:ATP-dependent Zn protease